MRNMLIGQGIVVMPMQMACAYTAMPNRGLIGALTKSRATCGPRRVPSRRTVLTCRQMLEAAPAVAEPPKRRLVDG